ncbi:hypothetical protein [Caulobacter sp. UNC279MFTsu5.1]|uniref:hypothetical protein n=1 Tax=Caulobacter sp. UNC279MFTsu5.1 TaxID=1502775 RepID=UPI0008E4BF58|nr:hypothetical protein [Caulobacter sp. UNC279MFTsu5.1]SFJ22316.1 hypothetical protein SAMN02799626_01331 [Caulobacter sp. UNC279MFTsu5.1]
MRILGLTLATVLAASAAAPAFAADRVSDSELVRASRCLGLAKAANLGPSDATALQAFVKTQGRGRDPLVQNRAENAEQAARSQAGKAKNNLKAALIAERDGVCKALVETSSTASAATPAGA